MRRLDGQEHYAWRDRQPDVQDVLDAPESHQRMNRFERRAAALAARRELIARQVASGALSIRFAKGEELQQLRADRRSDQVSSGDSIHAEAIAPIGAIAEAIAPIGAIPPTPTCVRVLSKPKLPRPERTCPMCGTKFRAKRSRGGMEQTYCGRSCSNRGRGKQAQAA